MIHHKRHQVDAAGTRVGTRKRRAGVLCAVVAAVALIGSPAIASAAPASTGSPVHGGCAAVVELQELSFPTAAGMRISPWLSQRDEGGTDPAAVAIVKQRSASADQLVVVIGTGSDAIQRTLYTAPSGCRIDWNGVGNVAMDEGGRRSVHTPAMTIRLIATTMPTCGMCACPV